MLGNFSMLIECIKKNKWLLTHLTVLLVAFIVVLITNFPFDSWYTGWDNLHPEFNFGLNFKNGLHAVWQPNQGLGTFGGHGYAATLPHTLITYLMSLVIPTQYIRAGFTFLTLFVGSVGIFFFIHEFMKKFGNIAYSGALVGGLYYMLNLATVQNFYIQLEAFIIHFAVLPWLFFSIHTYLKDKTRKNLLIFALISLLATAQGFIPPLFLVYFMMLSTYLLGYMLFKPKKTKILSSILLVVITLCINAYWLLPVVYYSKTNSDAYLNSYSNQASTGDFILKNKEFGDVKDVALLKGFILNSNDTENGVVFPIFGPWLDHLKKPFTQIAGYALFSVIVIGVVASIYKRQYHLFGLLLGFLLLFSFLANNTAPFSYITELFQNIPQFRQAFRIAFTKFSIGLAFYYALFLGIGVVFILDVIQTKISDKVEQQALKVIGALLIGAALVIFSLPIFAGNLLYRGTKITIPQSYFELYDFFKTQDPTERIADFPQGWHWGWTSTKWGYSGSGFLWYGIEQPILHRSFDVWGKQNENYYWELNRALYSENYDQLDSIFEKYQVQWILFDDSIYPYPNPKSLLYAARLQEHFQTSPNFTLEKTFSDGEADSNAALSVYRFNLKNKPNKFLTSINNSIPNVKPGFRFMEYDQAYEDNGTYLFDENAPFDEYYPFRNMFTKKSNQFSGISVDTNSSAITLVSTTPEMVHLPIQKGVLSDDIAFEISNTDVRATLNVQSLTKVYDSKNTSNITLEATNNESLHIINLDALEQRYGYIILVENKHIAGNRLRAAVIDWQSRKTDTEISLTSSSSFQQDFIIIPPMKQYGLGYTIQFTNTSIGDQPTINEIKRVEVYTFPYFELAELKIQNPTIVPPEHESVIMHGQSYNEGWKAYDIQSQMSKFLPIFFGEELKNHVLINNWANGWKMDQDAHELTIIFLPQYLEYIGFGLLFLSGLSIFIHKKT